MNFLDFLTLLDKLFNNALIGGLVGGCILFIWQKKDNQRREKINVFSTLMATRAMRVSPEHVSTLNKIDLAFYDDEEVINSWRQYLDHLNTRSDDLSGWHQRADQLMVDLLYTMGESVGRRFDKVHLKKGFYSPEAHGQWEQDSHFLRHNALKILSGEKAIPVKITRG